LVHTIRDPNDGTRSNGESAAETSLWTMAAG
jgi:hypothetical protein